MPWTHPACESLARLLGRHAGLHLPAERADAAEAGFRRAMARAGVRDPEEYLALVETDAEALADLVVEMTVGETYFFREPAQFAFIRREVLPDLLRRRGEAVIRAWSAGCASGEEIYSLAILLEEAGWAGGAYLLATDVSHEALARARQGSYTSWSLRGEGADVARPYLQRQGRRFVVPERLRRRVHFAGLNLAQDVYPSTASGAWGMDLVLCRNVLIYFDRDTIRAVARRLYDTLVPGGWLLTAAADPPLAGDAPFEMVVTNEGVFYRREAGPVPPRATAPAVALPDLPSPPLFGGQASASVPPHRASGDACPTGWPPARDPVEEAREELTLGNYLRACELAEGLPADPAACALHVRALANLETARAEQVCAAAAARHPLAVELHYLHAVLLLALRREGEAVRALRRVLYLDRGLALAHFLLASILEQRGDRAGAVRAFRNARDLCAGRPGDEVLPLADDTRAGELAEAAAVRLAVLEGGGKGGEE